MAKPVNHALRTHILTISFNLFLQNGFQGTTTREIALQAGIERGLLHHYFAKKQDILFTIYSDFLDCLHQFANCCYADLRGEQLVAFVNALYYRIIFSRAEITEIFTDILRNRDLTGIKIEKTTDVYYRIMEQHGFHVERQDVLLSSMIAIGAEVELVLAMREGRLAWQQRDLANQITRLEFMNLPGNELTPADMKELLDMVHELAENVDLSAFIEAMKGQCEWFEETFFLSKSTT